MCLRHEGERHVVLGAIERPACDDRVGCTVYDGDLRGVRDIDENAMADRVDRQRLWMCLHGQVAPCRPDTEDSHIRIGRYSDRCMRCRDEPKVALDRKWDSSSRYWAPAA